MPRTLTPTPDDAEPDPRPFVGSVYLDLDERALLDFPRGDYALKGEPAAPVSMKLWNWPNSGAANPNSRFRFCWRPGPV
jgi:hypothetical protein